MNTLNKMCQGCVRLQKDCSGTTNQVWTGCVYRKAGTEYQGSIIPIMPREDMEDKGVLISAVRTHAE